MYGSVLVFATLNWIYIELKTFIYITYLKTVLGDSLIWKFLALLEIIVVFLPDAVKMIFKNLKS